MVLSKPYTFSAEVYSWSIILWQVIKKYVPKVRVASKSTVLGYVIQDHEQASEPKLVACLLTRHTDRLFTTLCVPLADDRT